MTLQELITDLKAAGANENTMQLAMNCYELGRVNEREQLLAVCSDAVVAEREACAKVAEQHPAYDWAPAVCEITYAIRARGQQ